MSIPGSVLIPKGELLNGSALATLQQDKEIVVMGRPELTSLYAAALAEMGRTARRIDGERAFLAGILQIRKQIA